MVDSFHTFQPLAIKIELSLTSIYSCMKVSIVDADNNTRARYDKFEDLSIEFIKNNSTNDILVCAKNCVDYSYIMMIASHTIQTSNPICEVVFSC